MKNNYRFFLSYGIFWISYFAMVRLYFILFNINLLNDSSFYQVLGSFTHGFVMDLSMSTYFMVIPGLLMVLSIMLNKDVFSRPVHGYTFVLIIICSVVVGFDAKLYSFWGYRMDATPLLYLKTPQEAFASVTIGEIVINIFYAAVISAITIFLYRWAIQRKKVVDALLPRWYSLRILAVTLFLLLPIRGGFGVATMNTGWVFYCQNNFLNHAAINEVWNLAFSISEMNDSFKAYHFFEKKDAIQQSNALIEHTNKADTILLKTSHPNVILLIVESFTANVIEPLGGVPCITPRFNELSKEGVLFRNFYASGDRSDKGIVAILSGFPAQPSSTIIKYVNKTHSLPRLPYSLKKNGYTTAFYHGGDINFANMRSFLVDSYFDKIVSKSDFPKSAMNSKWGAHDHIVLKRLFDDMCKEKQPFFNACFTLSSHEPFEVPSHFISGMEEPKRFMNSIHYTDSCIGNFVDKCKLQPWWNNTIVIIVADHGHSQPKHLANSDPAKFHIPMLWIGGALATKGTVDKYASQTDIAATFLHQMGLPSDDYTYSRDLFTKNYANRIQYVFNNGFGQLQDRSVLIYDFGFKKVLKSNVAKPDSAVLLGKSYVQRIYNDIESR